MNDASPGTPAPQRDPERIPEPWATRLLERGFSDRRGGHAPSLSALAERAGLHTSTISSALTGRRAPSAATMLAIADALGVDVLDWFGAPTLGPWTPPPAAALLTARQRRALEELIAAMTAGESEA